MAAMWMNQLSLVVSRSPAMDPAIPHRAGKRRRRPRVERIGGLHVVVTVDECRGCVGRVQPIAIHQRMAVGLDHSDVLEPSAHQRIGGPERAAANVVGVRGHGADARNGQELRELRDVGLLVSVEVSPDRIDGVAHVVDWMR